MCGIAGYYLKMLPTDSQRLEDMARRLAHRGTNGQGVSPGGVDWTLAASPGMTDWFQPAAVRQSIAEPSVDRGRRWVRAADSPEPVQRVAVGTRVIVLRF